MTFDQWYSANVAPTLPTDIPPALRKAARESMAACWNAALDAIDCNSKLTVNGITRLWLSQENIDSLKVKP